MDATLEILLILLSALVLLYIARKIHQIHKRDLRIEAKTAYLSQLPANTLPADAPNFIIILTDDLGYADLSCFGAKLIHTPNVDALADQGVRFTSFYASAPVCSPSRAGLLTGRYPVRAHVPAVFFPRNSFGDIGFSLTLYSHGMKGLAPDEITLPEVLQRAGYATGMVGKWHLGDRAPHLPNQFGFDFFFGALYSNDMDPYHLYENDKIAVRAPVDQNFLTKKLTEQALQFIDEHADQPFFLYFAHPFPHHPLHASPDFQGTSQAGVYGDAVQEIDWSVGQIITALKEHGVYDNTFIAFTSDNGPWHEGNPGYHRGRKYLPFEGGVKVPLVASWPAKVPAGQVIDAVSMNLDFFPTCLSILGIPLPQDRIIDGQNMGDLLIGSIAASPYPPVFYFHDSLLQAVRLGKWKYHARHMSDNAAYHIMKPGPFLFNLEDDPNESYNQIMRAPDQGTILAQKLKEMRDSLKNNLRGWVNYEKS